MTKSVKQPGITIRIDVDVYNYLGEERENFETPNQVIKRLLGL